VIFRGNAYLNENAASEAKKKMFGIGYNTFLLYLHFSMLLPIAIGLAYVTGALLFTREPTAKDVARLKMVSWLTFLFVICLLIFGVLPDINFGSGAALSASYGTSYGNFTQQVTDASVGNFTGPLYFDMIEHVSFIGIGLAGAALALIWSMGSLVFTVRKLKWSILSILIIAVVWIFVLALMGITMTHTLAFPAGV
jgi:hypothetical protein